MHSPNIITHSSWVAMQGLICSQNDCFIVQKPFVEFHVFFQGKFLILTSNWTPTAGLTKTDFEYSLDQTDKPD